MSQVEAVDSLAHDERTGASLLPPAPFQQAASRHFRANNILGKTIPLALVVLAWKGYRLCVFEVGSYLSQIRHQPRLGLLYVAQFNLFFWSLVYCFLAVYLRPRHSAAPRDPPQEVLDRTVVYETELDGTPTRCYRDQCGGSWRSVRTRHCRDCGRCKTGFDHHCPFMDSCIATDTIKPFFTFLVFVLPLIGFAIIPLVPLQLAAVKEIIAATWSEAWMENIWWSHWYSWAGGPVWRYAAALVLGFWHYSTLEPPRPPLIPPQNLTQEASSYAYANFPCPTLSSPSLATLLTVTAGAFVFFIAIAMILTIVLNTRKGVSAVQLERIRRWKVETKKAATRADGGWDGRIRLWVPLEEHVEGGAVVLVDPGTLLYDFGPAENWRRMMGERWWQWFVPWTHTPTDDLEFSPAALEQLRDEARKRSL